MVINIVLVRFFLEILYGGIEFIEKGRIQVELIIEKKERKWKRRLGIELGEYYG